MATKTKKRKQETKKGNSIVAKISKKAKSIRKKGEKWQSAIKRASKLV